MIKRSRHQNYTEKTEMIRETKISNLMNDYFWYYPKSWERSNLKIEWRRKRKLKVSDDSCRSCRLHCFIAVVLNFDQRLLGNKDKTNNKRDWQKSDILIFGGRNLQGRNGKGPKPLGVKSEKGRNLWQPHLIPRWYHFIPMWYHLISKDFTKFQCDITYF